MAAVDYAEFSYANPDHPPLKRWTIRAIEGISGRRKLVDLYDIWKHQMVGTSDYIWSDLLGLINLNVAVEDGEWPPKDLPEGPLVLIANHPYGIGDGLAILALAEQLGRPFKILINNELLKVPEVRPFSLPVDFAVQAVAEGSPAQRAGLAPNQPLSAIDGKDLAAMVRDTTAPFLRLLSVERALQASLDENGAAELSAPGEAQPIAIPAEPVCKARFVVRPSGDEASADTTSVYIGGKFPGMA